MYKGEKPVVAVVGGGAAGLTASIFAANNKAKVILLEQLDRVGKKILATGNGRCNFSNTDLDISNYFGCNPKFAYSALKQFDYHKTIEFFDNLGITAKVEEDGKVFPASGQASSVLDVLRYEVERLGIDIVCNAKVLDISKNPKKFSLTLNNGSTITADKIIIATGGKAAPNLGSNGSGYLLAEKLGHRLVEPFPALVQLKLNAPFLKQIMGVKFIGSAEIIINNKPVAAAEGEILFTGYGISGPPILSISRVASEHIYKQEQVWLKVSIINYQSDEELENYLKERLQKQSHKSILFSMVGFINKRLIPVVLKEAGITDINKPAGQVTSVERKKIVSILRDWRFKVTGTNSWQFAQVTAGGVDVRDINQKTMESKVVPGIFFAGEIIDIDGACGGYNLQWAWSSGAIAGINASNFKNNAKL